MGAVAWALVVVLGAVGAHAVLGVLDRRSRAVRRCPLCRGSGDVPTGDPGLPPRRPHNAVTVPVDGPMLRAAVADLRVALQSEAPCTCRPNGLGVGKVYRCLRCLTLDATVGLGGAA